MQNRRQFLCTALQAAAGAGVTLLLTPLVTGCSSNNGSSPSTSTNPTVPSCDGAGATSTTTLGHSHTVCAPASDLQSPPAGGQTYMTSAASTDGHMHQVSLTQSQLAAIAQGQTVTVTTSVVESHTHDFSLNEAVAPAPTPTPTPAPTNPGPY